MVLCQADLIGHWLDNAHSTPERRRRLQALRKLGTRHEGGWWEYHGPAVLDLIRAWHVEWFPERDSDVVVMDGKHFVEQSLLAARLLVP